MQAPQALRGGGGVGDGAVCEWSVRIALRREVSGLAQGIVGFQIPQGQRGLWVSLRTALETLDQVQCPLPVRTGWALGSL